MFISPARVCYLYYDKGLTQQQIASRLGINRLRVSRILRQARSDGTVSVNINFHGFFPEMESALRILRRNVQFVICDPLDGSVEEARHSIAATAADYLAVALAADEKVAIGCGRTLRETADFISADFPQAQFIPLIGGQEGLGLDVHANSIAEVLAERTGGTARRVFSPALANSEEERAVLKGTPSISATLEAAAAAGTCLFSVEDPTLPDSTLSLAGYHTTDDIEVLRSEGAICDVLSISFLNAEGENCGRAVSGRSVSITDEQFRAIPRKICIAGGRTKHKAVAIALKLGLIDVLVTDAETAAYILGEEGLSEEPWMKANGR
ncbi:sugar-binding transcriptional regulator [Propionicicella superfundia]|uniref:sugar-binding transcriptional regulator n=1 Tax=Propionicicella superfundia TaxID=348582 RepID=UPI0004089E29|nr:sugar-binding domain-containing protein [Propionicicella superfundia]